MKNGVSGAPIPEGLPFAAEVTAACAVYDFPPCLAYAVKQNETDDSFNASEMQIGSVDGLMPDGSNAGHGAYQLTSSWNWNWYLPYPNAMYALEEFLVPAWNFWTTNTNLQGEDLCKAVGASFNRGLEGAYEDHLQGDVDSGTTDSYGARCVDAYRILIGG